MNVGAMRDGVVNANDVSVDMENGIEGHASEPSRGRRPWEI